MIVAIDGPAAAGKGTLAKRLAEHFDLAFLDTGRLYRAVGHLVLDRGGDPGNPADAVGAARALDPENLDSVDLYTETVAEAASKLAAIPDVRKVLLAFQQAFARTPPGGKPGAVLDGRDIGSVVCPDADVKLFVTARAEIRAERRHKELQEKGLKSTYAAVLAEIEARDERDRTRKVSPLKAGDAREIDTSEKSPDAVFEEARAYIEDLSS
ncbi:MAG: cytidylate kinase [Alphaproteobacteria bacterium]|nr:cytidylate kinase [Alphaproteobacteria bacterium]